MAEALSTLYHQEFWLRKEELQQLLCASCPREAARQFLDQRQELEAVLDTNTLFDADQEKLLSQLEIKFSAVSVNDASSHSGEGFFDNETNNSNFKSHDGPLRKKRK